MSIHEMQILDKTGHSQLKWDPDNREEVESARAMFDAMSGRGFRAFASDNGRPGRRIDTFDPAVARMVFVPHLAGG